MTTDRESMSKEGVVDPNKPMSAATGSGDDLTPTLTLMDGDMVAAFARLERIITAIESEDEPNTEILETAKGIKLHYRETKTITKEQYEWMQGVAAADPGEGVPGPHGVPASEVDDPSADEEGLKDLDDRIKKMQAEKDKEAPPPPIPVGTGVGQVHAKLEADVPPSGEEAVDGSPEPEPVVEEQPADAPDEPVAEETPEETPEEETPQS